MNANEGILVKYKNEKTVCKCGSHEIMFEGEFRQRLPLGFGFHPGETRFCVDLVELKGWYGTCMDCRTKVKAYKTKKLVTKRLTQ